MPTINSYSTLTQAILDWSHRSDLASYVDYFIQSAQDAIENDIPDLNFGNCIALQEAAYGPVQISSNGTTPVPTDWIAPKVFSIADGLGDIGPLEFKTPAWLYDTYPARLASGIPAYVSRDMGWNLTTDQFTCGAGQTLFALSVSPTSAPLVSLDGVILYLGTDYALDGNVLLLAYGAEQDQTLAVSYVQITATSTTTATAGQTAFTVTAAPSIVALDGVMLYSGIDYSVSGTTLTLAHGASAGQVLTAFYAANLVTQVVPASSVMSGTDFPVALVSCNGVVLYPGIDYTVANGIVTFLTPLSGTVAIVSQTGTPASVFVYGPYPDSGYFVQGTYYAKAPLLSSSQTTNWMVLSAPDVILSACMKEAGRFIKDAAMVQDWDARYQQKLKALVDRDKAERWAATMMAVNVG